MKILVTETQLKKIIKESVSSRYSDYLLDKISEKGIESLTPEERKDLEYISKGRNVEKEIPALASRPPLVKSASNDDDDFDETIEKPGDDSKNDTDMGHGGWNNGESFDIVITLIRNLIEHDSKFNIDVDGIKWYIRIVDPAELPPAIKLSDGKNKFFVLPFWDGPGLTIVPTSGKRAFAKVENIPQDYDEGQDFIQSFVDIICPSLIKRFNKLK